MTETNETKPKEDVKEASSVPSVTPAKTPEKETQADITGGVFAVIATGGKQYVVREGDTVTIEKLTEVYQEGEKVSFDDVLLFDNGTTTQVGAPTVAGVKVEGEFLGNGRAKKISVIRFRAKSRYFKNRGHRQPYTRVKITHIG